MRNAIVTANVISVRSGRGKEFSQLGTYKKDDRIIVLDSALTEDYAMVLWQAGYACSKAGQYIQYMNPQSPDLSGSAPNATVTASSTVVREGRGANYAVLGEYPLGKNITVLDSTLNQEYAQVVWKTGYAYSNKGEYIQFSEEFPDEPNAVVTASRISVRSGRDVSYPKLGEFVKDAGIIVLDDTLNYNYVHVVWNGSDAYAYCDFGKYIAFTLEEAGDGNYNDMEPNAAVTANTISVREGRGYSYNKLGTLSKGDKIVVIDETLDFEYAMIRWGDGKAYAYSDYGKYIGLPTSLSRSHYKYAQYILKSCVGGKYILGAQGTKITKVMCLRAGKPIPPISLTDGLSSCSRSEKSATRRACGSSRMTTRGTAAAFGGTVRTRRASMERISIRPPIPSTIPTAIRYKKRS